MKRIFGDDFCRLGKEEEMNVATLSGTRLEHNNGDEECENDMSMELVECS